jgi:hypothetical protein
MIKAPAETMIEILNLMIIFKGSIDEKIYSYIIMLYICISMVCSAVTVIELDVFLSGGNLNV